MKNNNHKLYIICSNCYAILSEENIWINKKDNKELYEILKEKYQGQMTGKYCPSCEEKIRNEIKKIKKLPNIF